jgi:hypothetical protein
MNFRRLDAAPTEFESGVDEDLRRAIERAQDVVALPPIVMPYWEAIYTEARVCFCPDNHAHSPIGCLTPGCNCRVSHA